ncbi:uncharacterized protein LOC122074242 [Macadamia integrifolia]|uniref:uncharacterized protein LOC122074242 n=1 Tax=Macadamia integrifolia TaxID=60698 RepID=UPI001C50168F|nr:uncharacterized protein LOC122074242 [Macadamia integrifolia]
MANFFCKVLSKIMIERLACLLPCLVSDEKGVFQKGKIISANIGLASELANLLYTSIRGGGMGIKVDVQKAYDTLILILLNGGLVGFFGVERGLRQGDPISPMLFILVEEVLSRGLYSLLKEGKLKALPGPRGVSVPSHLLYVDDIFIFMNAAAKHVHCLREFLLKYQEFFGQSFNLEKSKIFFSKVAPHGKRFIADLLNIPICSLLIRYLGVEIFKGIVKKDRMLPLMDKIKARMQGWRGKLLPIHNFLVYWWPESVIIIVERWMRNFLWSWDIDTVKKISVKWEEVCKPKAEGGLGIRRLRDVNCAGLSKLVWQMKHEKTAFSSFLWVRFVNEGGVLKKGYKSSFVLKGIAKMWNFVSEAER